MWDLQVSVCAAARDSDAAQQVAEMWRSTGRELDTILYTNVIAGLILDLGTPTELQLLWLSRAVPTLSQEHSTKLCGYCIW